jgi:hypothetical protein
MAKIDVLGAWRGIARFLPAEYEVLACEHQQVETKFGNAKIRDADMLLRFIMLHVGADLPLRQTVAVMAEAGAPSLSPMRLHKKMARAAPYLRALVERMVEWPTDGAPERWGGYVFCAVDATVVCGPGATGHRRTHPHQAARSRRIAQRRRGHRRNRWREPLPVHVGARRAGGR